MNVAQLIEALREMPQDLEVMIYAASHEDGGGCDAVSLVTRDGEKEESYYNGDSPFEIDEDLASYVEILGW